MFDFKKILIAGDIHGDLNHALYLMQTSIENNCNAILQCGDWGYYPKFCFKYINIFSQESILNNIPIFFIDGNHENHSELRNPEYQKTEEGFVELKKNLYYIPRGTRWKWNNVNFLGVGGASSIDKKEQLAREKTPRTLWFEEEIISYNEFNKAVDPGQTDILICHDVPYGTKIPGFNITKYYHLPTVEYNQKCIANIIDLTKPRLVVHGHLHYYYGSVIEHSDKSKTLITGLNCNGSYGESFLIVDLNNFSKNFLKKAEPTDS